MGSAITSTTGATSSWCRRCSAPRCCWGSSGTPATRSCGCWGGGPRARALCCLAAQAERCRLRRAGGREERAATARALPNNPEIILMDEPFGALDAQTREVLQDELGRIQRVEHKTVLFVTHSIREAVYLADRVVVMTTAPGRIKQVFQIKLPEVRDRFAPEFTHYESEITRVVKEEVAKVHE